MQIELTPELKSEIDALSQYQLCSIWRFAKLGHKYLLGTTEGTVGDYFAKRLNEMGGFTPEISKSLGWD